ncbi:MAG TPA: DUF4160 domain-containing protein [Thermoanaerobaculia bacterium]|nr:DUF4160 domain-containing protein [Thermoanaerobaculia bacterium]
MISMFWNDHAPPHFHARYGEYEITVEIESGVVEGKFPPRSLNHVIEWHRANRGELLLAWEQCRRGEAPRPIAPLE